MKDCALCVLQVNQVVQQSPNHPNEDVLGSLVMTASHMIFQEPSGRRETWVSASACCSAIVTGGSELSAMVVTCQTHLYIV